MENKKRLERRKSSQNNGGKFSAWRQINGLCRTVVGGDTHRVAKKLMRRAREETCLWEHKK
jgi:hypothetical protein